jgi:hypothetical protein
MTNSAADRATPGPVLVSTWQAAFWYAERCGWYVLPIWGGRPDGQCECGCPHDERCTHQPTHRPRDIGKHPVARDGCPADPADASRDRAEVSRWYRRRPTANVAVALRPSGLVVVDCDGLAAYDEAQARGIPAGAPRVSTGQPDHWHVYLRRPSECPTARAIHRGASGAIDVLSDGYAVLPPSRHRSGQAYAWTPDTTLGRTVQLPEAPNWLVAILREAAAHRSSPRVHFGDDEDTTANGAVIWAQVRPRLDARIVCAVEGGPDAYEALDGGDSTRSGCDAAVCHALVRAGLNDDAIRALYRALPVGQRGKYAERGDPYLATTLANTRAYVEQHTLALPGGADAKNGVTMPTNGRGGSHNSQNSHNSPPVPDSANSANGAKGSGAWSRPVSLVAGHGPDFPVAVIPGWLGTWVEATATATQTPLALPAMMALAVVAAACARRVEVRVRPGWTEPLNLFTVTTLGPGNRKSAVVREATAPLEAWEHEATQRLALTVGEAETHRRVLEGRLRKLQQSAAQATDPIEREALEAEAVTLAQELAGTPVSALPRLIVDDCTPERLASLLHEQGGRLAVLSPEGGVFDILAGRYSATGAPNFEVFLKGHAGDTLRVDRVGRAAEFVEQPALTVGLAVQPAVLGGLLERAHFRGRGLLGRFLYAMPASLLGRRDTQAPPVSEAIRAAYHQGVRALLALEPATPYVLTLSPDARAAFEAFYAALEPRLGEDGDLALITDWAGKLAGTVARLAGLLHLAAHAAEPTPWAGAVDAMTMAQAVTLGDWLTEHAKVAFAVMGADPAIEEARHLLRWLGKEPREAFTKRETFEGTKGRFKRVEAMEPALRLLLECGYIREQEPPEQASRPGRKASPVYEVNPWIYSQNSHNSQNATGDDISANPANCANASEPPIDAAGPPAGENDEAPAQSGAPPSEAPPWEGAGPDAAAVTLAPTIPAAAPSAPVPSAARVAAAAGTPGAHVTSADDWEEF